MQCLNSYNRRAGSVLPSSPSRRSEAAPLNTSYIGYSSRVILSYKKLVMAKLLGPN